MNTLVADLLHHLHPPQRCEKAETHGAGCQFPAGHAGPCLVMALDDVLVAAQVVKA